MKMAEEGSTEALDDIRKKRLAYFKSQQERAVSQPKYTDEQNLLENVPTSVENRTHDVLKEFDSGGYQNEVSLKNSSSSCMYNSAFASTYPAGDFWKDDSGVTTRIKSHQSDISGVIERNGSASVDMNSNAYVIPNLRKENKSENHPLNRKSHTRDASDNCSLDGYNETVERLIRATKEELLGKKSNDDIWQHIQKIPETDNSVIDDDIQRHKQCTSKLSQNIILNNCQSEIRENVSTEDQNYLLKNEKLLIRTDYLSKYDESDDTRFHTSENSSLNVPSSEHIKESKMQSETDGQYIRKHTEDIATFVPPMTKQNFEANHQSYDRVKVEAIFSSRHAPWPQTLKTQIDLQESLDIELVSDKKTAECLDYSDLGLSTHRPAKSADINRESVKASDLNLGETVTKELKTVLGEEKFQQFLTKSKREIDDLHENKSDRSARKDKTPRLIKEDAQNVKQLKSTPITVIHRKTELGKQKYSAKEEKLSQRYSRQVSEPVHQKLSEPIQSLTMRPLSTSDSIENQFCLSCRSSDITPRMSNGEAVSNIIEEHVLGNKDKKACVSNPFFSPEGITQSDEKQGGSESGMVVPELNLSEINHSESPRPKLNRPKHEPFNIYQEKTKSQERQVFDKAHSRTNSISGYEQVPVSKNIVFSSDEIYSQAYGGFYHSNPDLQIVSPIAVSAYHKSGQLPVQSPEPVSISGPAFTIPFTPTSPVFTSSHVTQPTTHSQVHTGQSSTSSHFDEVEKFRHYDSNAMRHQAFTWETMQVPHPPNLPLKQNAQQPTQIQTNGNLYDYTQNFRGYYTGLGSNLTANLPVSHIPHPPQVPAMLENAAPVQPNLVSSFQLQQGMHIGCAGYTFPVTMTPHPLELETHKREQDDQVQHNLTETQTQSTSNAEVQTDKEKQIEVEKVHLVEESTFTSVSQILDTDVKVPHPPTTKKGKGSSPRKPVKGHNPNRHIDGIRQHHEQRRQEQEETKLTDEEILARQRRFAKASLERYFASLENLYMTSKFVKPTTLSDMSDGVFDVLNETDSEGEGEDDENGESKRTNNSTSRFQESKKAIDFKHSKENEVHHQTANDIIEAAHEHHLDVGKSADEETLVNSEVTGLSVKAGGVTERLEGIGVHVSHINDKQDLSRTNENVNVKKKLVNQGKRLLICPECEGLNKEYMSWCTHCGEMIIGVEPKLVSRTRDGRLRIKPVVESKLKTVTTLNHNNSNAHSIEINYIQEIPDKPFSLDLEELKSDERESSPVKSDGKDSGRPSSDDRDNDTHAHENEQVVDDICHTKEYPVVQGYVRSHLAKQIKMQSSTGIDFSRVKDSQQGTVKIKTELDDKRTGSFHANNFAYQCSSPINMGGITELDQSVNLNAGDSTQKLSVSGRDRDDVTGENSHSDNGSLYVHNAVSNSTITDFAQRNNEVLRTCTKEESIVTSEQVCLPEIWNTTESEEECKLKKDPIDNTAQFKNTQMLKTDLAMDSIGASYLIMSKKHNLLEPSSSTVNCESRQDVIHSNVINCDTDKEGCTSVFELNAHMSIDKDASCEKNQVVLSSLSAQTGKTEKLVEVNGNSSFLKNDRDMKRFVGEVASHKNSQNTLIHKISNDGTQCEHLGSIEKNGLTSLQDNGSLKEEVEKVDKLVNKSDFTVSQMPPMFSTHVPVSQSELSLKLPANSMEFSMDYSQSTSCIYEALDEFKTEEELKAVKEERKKERRRKKGHGAIDVEVFGIEEMRESRNSSRGQRLVPILNLAGNSSDEDDFSMQSDTKSDVKQDMCEKSVPFISKTTASGSAWEPDITPQQPHIEKENSLEVQKHSWSPDTSARTLGTSSPRIVQDPLKLAVLSESNADWKLLFDPQQDQQIEQDTEDQNGTESTDVKQPFLKHVLEQSQQTVKAKRLPKSASKPVQSKVRQSIEEPCYKRKWARSSMAWSSYNTGELNTNSSLRSSAELSRPSSAPKSRTCNNSISRNQNLTLKGNYSIRQPAGKTKRPWSADMNKRLSRSTSDLSMTLQASTNQNSRDVPPNNITTSKDHHYNNISQEKDSPYLSRDSLSPEDNVTNTANASKCLEYVHGSLHRQDSGADHSQNTDQNCYSTVKEERRPQSFCKSKGKQGKQKKKTGNKSNILDLSVDLITVEHRLPKPGVLELLSDFINNTSPKSTYDKYIEMTPRIEAGTMSKWQCLPDEILLHVFAHLDQTSLSKCAQVCHQFYRVAMDESLWKYITVKKRNDLDDNCLMEIAKRHPVSLALIQCQGEQVTAKGLRDLFRECSPTLKELNISLCSKGALQGDSLLLHAAARCNLLTHIDTSWCSVTDSGLMAISNTVDRLESFCINGCQAISDDGLETIIKKHGIHLRHLELFGCFNLSPRGLRCISNNCINLLSINLGNCYKLTDSCIAQLSASLGRVESLDLRGCKQLKDNSIRRVVKNCPRLMCLSLANCPNITDVSLLEISTYLTDIRSIDLCGCKNVTDSSLRALVNTCTNLREIDISSTGCTHRSVAMIANFSGQRLETLKINFLSDVTEQSLIKLAKHCRRLNVAMIANFSGQRLETLKINFLSDVTEQSLIKLAKHCRRLKSVHMYGCPSVRNMSKIQEERPTFAIHM